MTRHQQDQIAFSIVIACAIIPAGTLTLLAPDLPQLAIGWLAAVALALLVVSCIHPEKETHE